MTHDVRDIEFGVGEIAKVVESWLNYNTEARIKEKLTTTDDTCIMIVPYWPSRGALKLWVETLNAAAERLSEINSRLVSPEPVRNPYKLPSEEEIAGVIYEELPATDYMMDEYADAARAVLALIGGKKGEG